MAGGVDHPEPGHLVALLKDAVNLARGTRPVAHDHPVHEVALMFGWRHRPAALHRVDVVRVACERYVARLAHLRDRALVIGMGVRQRDDREPPILDLTADPAPRAPRGGVDQHVLREIDVDPVGRQTPELPQIGRELLQARTE
jgi:hypothetical protein